MVYPARAATGGLVLPGRVPLVFSMPSNKNVPRGPSDPGGLRRVPGRRPNLLSRRTMFSGSRARAHAKEDSPVVTSPRVDLPKADPKPGPKPDPKPDPKRRTSHDDLIIMLVGLAFLIAGTGHAPYLATFFSRGYKSPMEFERQAGLA